MREVSSGGDGGPWGRGLGGGAKAGDVGCASPSLSGLLSIVIHSLYWPSSWRSKEGKGGARPGSYWVWQLGRSLFSQLRIWRQPVLQAQVSFHLAVSHICSWLFISHTAVAVCFIHYLQSRRGCHPHPAVLRGSPGTCRSLSPVQGSLQSRTIS